MGGCLGVEGSLPCTFGYVCVYAREMDGWTDGATSVRRFSGCGAARERSGGLFVCVRVRVRATHPDVMDDV